MAWNKDHMIHDSVTRCLIHNTGKKQNNFSPIFQMNQICEMSAKNADGQTRWCHSLIELGTICVEDKLTLLGA